MSIRAFATAQLSCFLHLYSAEKRHDRAQWGSYKRTVQISHAHLDAERVLTYKRGGRTSPLIKPYEMSRSFVVPLAVLALLQAAVATNVIDLSTTRNVEIQLTDEDVVPKTELVSQCGLSIIPWCISR